MLISKLKYFFSDLPRSVEKSKSRQIEVKPLSKQYEFESSPSEDPDEILHIKDLVENYAQIFSRPKRK